MSSTSRRSRKPSRMRSSSTMNRFSHRRRPTFAAAGLPAISGGREFAVVPARRLRRQHLRGPSPHRKLYRRSVDRSTPAALTHEAIPPIENRRVRAISRSHLGGVRDILSSYGRVYPARSHPEHGGDRRYRRGAGCCAGPAANTRRDRIEQRGRGLCRRSGRILPASPSLARQDRHVEKIWPSAEHDACRRGR